MRGALIHTPKRNAPPAMTKTKITLSVISHGQGDLVRQLLADVEACCAGDVGVIVTHNIPEPVKFRDSDYSFPLVVIQNQERKGFAANHNQAFHQGFGDYFCIVNPDVRLVGNPFPALRDALAEADVGVVGPAVLNVRGEIEPSARKFPTLQSIMRKVLAWKPLHDYSEATATREPDWIAGTFMMFKSEAYARIGGVDERYFLYYEDVDLCARLRIIGLRVVLEPNVRIIHDASRRSWGNLYYMMIHARSMLRFLKKRPSNLGKGRPEQSISARGLRP